MLPQPDLDAFNCGFLVTNADRRIIYANSYFATEYGLDSQALAGNGLEALFTRSSLILFDSYLYPMLMHEGLCQELQVMIKPANGDRVQVLISVKEDPSGSGHHYWALFDATNRTKLYDELIETRERLQGQAESFADLAKRDALTGLWNRRELNEQLMVLLAQANRSQRPVSVLMVDIDFFKAVNDQFGHQRGDMVLREFGEMLSHSIRTGDIAARFGGEEFLVVLPDTPIDAAASWAERVHENLKRLRIADLSITVSVGISEKAASREADAEELIRMADEALYLAKREGRDRTCLAVV